MASDINNFQFTGNLTRDGELKYTNSGMAVCKFSIAVNKKFKDNESTSFFNCVIFGKFGEAVNQYLTKGLPVAVGGEVKQNKWEQDGQTRYGIDFIVDSMRMFGNRNNSGGGNQGSYQGNQGNQNNQGGYNNQRSGGPKEPPAYGGPEEFEDDIPF